jgi:hypothetical protein
MATSTSVSPYFDDYSEDKNFYRVLYKPGVAIQSRELNQSQTILQNQIKRVGDYLFNNGQRIKGSNPSVNLDARTVRLTGKNINGQNIVLDEFLGKYVTSLNTDIIGYVEFVFERDDPQIGDLPCIVISLKKFNDANNGFFFELDTLYFHDTLTEALNKKHNGNKYAIVRISSKNEEQVKKIICDNHWHWVIYDSLSKNKDGEIAWNNMCNSPDKDTVILLREKCRMGKNLEKSHILFCFETAKNSKTDTVLQGLLGRVCGYSLNSENIDVYLSNKICKSGEIDRYIELSKGIEYVPTRASNIKGIGCLSKRMAISIIKIDKIYTSINECGDYSRVEDDVRAAFNENTIEQSNNSDILKIIKSVIDNKDTEFVTHILDKKNKTYKNVPKQILESLSNKTPFHGTNGCGFKSDNPLQVNIWIVKNVNELKQGDIYVDCYVPRTDNTYNIPLTTKREVFAHKLEDERIAISNGSFNIYLRPETSRNVDFMLSDLINMVNLSMNNINTSRSVCSNQDFETKENKGIYVSDDVLKSLQKNGKIYNEIYNEFRITIKIIKASGKIPQFLKENGLSRLASISW